MKTITATLAAALACTALISGPAVATSETTNRNTGYYDDRIEAPLPPDAETIQFFLNPYPFTFPIYSWRHQGSGATSFTSVIENSAGTLTCSAQQSPEDMIATCPAQFLDLTDDFTLTITNWNEGGASTMGPLTVCLTCRPDIQVSLAVTGRRIHVSWDPEAATPSIESQVEISARKADGTGWHWTNAPLPSGGMELEVSESGTFEIAVQLRSRDTSGVTILEELARDLVTISTPG